MIQNNGLLFSTLSSDIEGDPFLTATVSSFTSSFEGEFSDEDSSINSDLRSLLYKAFQTEAQKHGFQLNDVNDTSNIVYNLSCKIINN